MSSNQEFNDLKSKLSSLQAEQSYILKIFGLLIVEATFDFRIMNIFGSIEDVFPDAEKYFERGKNLVKAVYKVTQNTHLRPESEDDTFRENEIEIELEQVLIEFVSGNRDEKRFEILGETETGDLFLLIWNITKRSKTLRSYFKIVPSNSIVKSLQEQHTEELSKLQIEQRRIFENIRDGITLLDLKNKIIYMNENAKTLFFSSITKIVQKANFEGRFLQEILVNESPDLIKRILDFNHDLIENRLPIDYTAKFSEQSVNMHLRPIFNERSYIIGVLIITQKNRPEFNVDLNKVVLTLKDLYGKNAKLQTRLKEYEVLTNNLNENISNLQKTIRLIYKYLDRIPVAITILNFSTRTYDFVNTGFEKITETTRVNLHGKSDQDVFPSLVAKSLNKFIDKTIADSNQNTFEYDIYRIKQQLMFNEHNEPKGIVRIIEQINED